MRIIAGSRRGARLATLQGRDVRPTSDRVREALFGVLDGGRLGWPYRDRLVVDAFAGTGALGLEALSRGAARAVFLENARASCAILRQNIRILGCVERTTVIEADAARLERPAPEPAGLVMLDPPYRSDAALPCLKALWTHGWIAAGTVVVLETATRTELDLPDWLQKADERRHGATSLVFARAA